MVKVKSDMVFQAKHYTVEEFDEFVDLPINKDKLFEYIGGEVLEVPSNPYSSYLATRLSRFIANFVEEHQLGFVTGEAGGYMVSGERYAPDVAFISFAKQKELAKTGYNPNPPDLAVEVLSPTDSEKKLSVKISNYLAAQTSVLVIYPDEREIAVHKPGQPVAILGIEDILTIESVLPDFKVAVKDIFPTQDDE